MARLICASDPKTPSERVFLRELQRQLDDSFIVIGNLSYLTGDRLEQGEVDAVVLHRTMGMLYLECKGTGVVCDEDGNWKRLQGNTWRPLSRSPGEQVVDHARKMQAIVYDRLKKRAAQCAPGTQLALAWGWGLVFPFTKLGVDMPLPLNLPRNIIADATDLADLGGFVQRLMHLHWAKRGKPAAVFPDDDRWQKAVIEALHPNVEFVASLGGRVDAAKIARVRLSERQRHIIECLEDNEQFAVCGGAGTGKSLLALETARRWAERKGRAVLLVCFNRALAARLSSAVDTMDLQNGRIVVSHFHGLIDDAMQRLGAQSSPPPDATDQQKRHYFEEELPRFLEQAINQKLMPIFDALIVDEAQDFHDQWWYYLQQLVHGHEKGPLVLFHDPDQQIFERPVAMPDLFTLKLVENYRNGDTIAELASSCTELPLRSHPDVHEAEPIAVHGAGSTRHLVRSLDERVAHYLKQALTLESMIVLGPHRLSKSSLGDVGEIGGFPLHDSHEHRDGHLRYCTIGSFKGLEAEVVFLIDADEEDARFDRSARYVAVSRATHALHIYQKGSGWSRAAAFSGGRHPME